MLAALKKMTRAIRADHRAIQKGSAKYKQHHIPEWKLPVHLLTKVGFQMTAAVRVMQCSKELGLPLAPQTISRGIRHLYGAEIHWDADIEAGVIFVHGNGLVISKAAHVKSGAILFQNVTLGLGTDPKTRKVGAPCLEANVHIGPGATLLGPIRIGENSKVMAGATLAESIESMQVVKPAAVTIQSRKNKGPQK